VAFPTTMEASGIEAVESGRMSGHRWYEASDIVQVMLATFPVNPIKRYCSNLRQLRQS